MAGTPETGTWDVDRRAVLGTAAAGAVGLTSGCVQRARSLVSRRTPEQLSLTIKTVPADADEPATKIARSLSENLQAVGVDAEIRLLAEDELLREVLVNHSFDLYVARFPGDRSPDFLRPFLHSRFAAEPGWQNPFGFSDLSVDDLLVEQQRRAGEQRAISVENLQRQVVRRQPFIVAAFPDWIGAARSDRFEGFGEFRPDSPLRYVALDRSAASTADGAGDADGVELRTVITDGRVTENTNPIAVEFRNDGTITGLLYDQLGRRIDGDVTPWLARDWSWAEPEPGRAVATVDVREGRTWHDGKPLTAGDVAFTYRFLADTSLGRGDVPVPAPRYRGRISMVESVEAVDDGTLRVEFADTSPEVAARAFTVPVLPRHEWEPKAREADLVGLDLFDGVTEALVWPNPEPVGSGPLQFESRTPGERLVLSRFADHFVEDDAASLPGRFTGGLAYDRFVARVAPSEAVAVELVAEGEADATLSALSPAVVPQVGRYGDVALQVDGHHSFYHVGFNVRRGPMANPRFRRVVAMLVDRQQVVDDVLGGYARPAVTPVRNAEWTPQDLRWDDGAPALSFVGTDGDLDVQAARAAFRDAGYQYDDDGRLLEQ